MNQRSYPYPGSADMPCGRLCLQIYSPYYRAEWLRRWSEEKLGDLVSKLPGIVKFLIAEAPVLADRVEVERKRRALEWQQHQLVMQERQRQEEAKRRLKVIQDSRDRLETVIQPFFDYIERSAQKLGPEQRTVVMERLAKAKELIGDLDALKHFNAWEPPVL